MYNVYIIYRFILMMYKYKRLGVNILYVWIYRYKFFYGGWELDCELVEFCVVFLVVLVEFWFIINGVYLYKWNRIRLNIY